MDTIFSEMIRQQLFQYEHCVLLELGGDTSVLKCAPFLTRTAAEMLHRFHKSLITKTLDFAGAFLISWDTYSAYRDAGYLALKKTLDFLQEKAPQIPVILDSRYLSVTQIGRDSIEFFSHANVLVTEDPEQGKVVSFVKNSELLGLAIEPLNVSVLKNIRNTYGSEVFLDIVGMHDWGFHERNLLNVAGPNSMVHVLCGVNFIKLQLTKIRIGELCQYMRRITTEISLMRKGKTI